MMRKEEFLAQLRDGLAGLPQKDIDERVAFYSEMIDDRMEDGVSETEAVSGIGAASEIVSQIITETPLTKIAKQRRKAKRQMKVWEIVLLILGSPVWLSLLIAAFAVALSLYAVLWSGVISLWAVFAAVIACAVAGVFGGILFLCKGNALPGIAIIGAAIACAGVGIFLFYGCKLASVGMGLLTKKILLWIKRSFMKREDA